MVQLLLIIMLLQAIVVERAWTMSCFFCSRIHKNHRNDKRLQIAFVNTKNLLAIYTVN